eukprot:TRINITY_DN10299_c1_g1_i2.p1 TRINITY_DN10299_c1_g1~~TRINITY_DN10299_c1_g1_i2.p1  ORF type:complete len:3754 (+),score=937.90 TRINITY_DN10299_c1_g1_i2:113-11374(+)
MLEKYVGSIFTSYLGRYVANLNRDQLRVSVWRGKVSLTDLQLRSSALDQLRLPFFVERGVIGSLDITIPWTRLQTQSCVVDVRDVTIVVGPKRAQAWDQGAEAAAALADKLQRLELWELERGRRSEGESPAEGADSPDDVSAASEGFVARLAASIVGNIKVQVANVHVRYEDACSLRTDPYSVSVRFAQLRCCSTDPDWAPAFIAVQRRGWQHKAIDLTGLAVTVSGGVFGARPDLGDLDWAQAVREAEASGAGSAVLPPVESSVRLRYQGARAQRQGQPDCEAVLRIEALHVALQRTQYLRLRRLADYVASYPSVAWLRRLRPAAAVAEAPAAWWRFAIAAVREQCTRTRFSWPDYLVWRQRRDRYVHLHMRKQGVAWLDPLTGGEEAEYAALQEGAPLHDLQAARQRAYARLSRGEEEWERREALRRERRAAAAGADASGAGGWGWFSYYMGGGTAGPEEAEEDAADIAAVRAVIEGDAVGEDVRRRLREEMGWGSDDEEDSPRSASPPRAQQQQQQQQQQQVSICTRLEAESGSLRLTLDAHPDGGGDGTVGVAEFGKLGCKQESYRGSDAFRFSIALHTLEVAGHDGAALPFQLRRSTAPPVPDAAQAPLVSAFIERHPTVAASPSAAAQQGASYSTEVSLAPVVAAIDAAWVDALHAFFRSPYDELLSTPAGTGGAQAVPAKDLSRRGAVHALSLVLDREDWACTVSLDSPTLVVPCGGPACGALDICLVAACRRLVASTSFPSGRRKRMTTTADLPDGDFYDSWEFAGEGVSGALADTEHLRGKLLQQGERPWQPTESPAAAQLVAPFTVGVTVGRSLVPRLHSLPWLLLDLRCDTLQLGATRRKVALCVAAAARLIDSLGRALAPPGAVEPGGADPTQVRSVMELQVGELELDLTEDGVEGVAPAAEQAPGGSAAAAAGSGGASAAVQLGGARLRFSSRSADARLHFAARSFRVLDLGAPEGPWHELVSAAPHRGGERDALTLGFDAVWDESPLWNPHRGSNRSHLALEGVRVAVTDGLARLMECLWDLAAVCLFSPSTYYTPCDRDPELHGDGEGGAERERPVTEFLLTLDACELLCAEQAADGAVPFVEIAVPRAKRGPAAALQDALAHARAPALPQVCPADGTDARSPFVEDPAPARSDAYNVIEYRKYARSAVLSGRLRGLSVRDASGAATRFPDLLGPAAAGAAGGGREGDVEFTYLMLQGAADRPPDGHCFTHFVRCSVQRAAVVYSQTLVFHLFQYFTTGVIARLCSVPARPYFETPGGGACWDRDKALGRPQERDPTSPGEPHEYLSIDVLMRDTFILLPPLPSSEAFFEGKLEGLRIANRLVRADDSVIRLELAYLFDGMSLWTPGCGAVRDALPPTSMELLTQWAVRDPCHKLPETQNTLTAAGMRFSLLPREYHTFLSVLGDNLMHGYPRRDAGDPQPPPAPPTAPDEPTHDVYSWRLHFGEMAAELRGGQQRAVVHMGAMRLEMLWQSNGVMRTGFRCGDAAVRWTGGAGASGDGREVFRCRRPDGAAGSAFSVDYDFCGHSRGPEGMRPARPVAEGAVVSVTRCTLELQWVAMLAAPRGLFFCRDFLFSEAALQAAASFYVAAAADAWQTELALKLGRAQLDFRDGRGVFASAHLEQVAADHVRHVDAESRASCAVGGLSLTDVRRQQTAVERLQPSDRFADLRYTALPGQRPKAEMTLRPVRLLWLGPFAAELLRRCASPEFGALQWLAAPPAARPSAVAAALGCAHADTPRQQQQEGGQEAAAPATHVDLLIDILNPTLVVPTRADHTALEEDRVEFDFGRTRILSSLDPVSGEEVVHAELSAMHAVAVTYGRPLARGLPASPPRRLRSSEGSRTAPSAESPPGASIATPVSNTLSAQGEARREVLCPVDVHLRVRTTADGSSAVVAADVSPVSVVLSSAHYSVVLRAVADNILAAPADDDCDSDEESAHSVDGVEQQDGVTSPAPAKSVTINIPSVRMQLPGVLDFNMTSLNAGFIRRSTRTTLHFSLEASEAIDTREEDQWPENFRKPYQQQSRPMNIVLTSERRADQTWSQSLQIALGMPTVTMIPDALYAVFRYVVPPFRSIFGRGEHWVRRVEISDNVTFDHDVQLSPDKEVWRVSGARYNRVLIDLGCNELRLSSSYWSTRPLITLEAGVTLEIRCRRIALPRGVALEALCSIGEGSYVLQRSPNGSPLNIAGTTRQHHSSFAARQTSMLQGGAYGEVHNEFLVSVDGGLMLVIADAESKGKGAEEEPSSRRPSVSPNLMPQQPPRQGPVRVIVASCEVRGSLTQQHSPQGGALLSERGVFELRHLCARTELREGVQDGPQQGEGEANYIIAPCEIKIPVSTRTSVQPMEFSKSAVSAGVAQRLSKSVEVHLVTPLRARVSFQTVSMVRDLLLRGRRVAYGEQPAARHTEEPKEAYRELEVAVGAAEAAAAAVSTSLELHGNDVEVIWVDDCAAMDMPLFKLHLVESSARVKTTTSPAALSCTAVVHTMLQHFRQEHCLWEPVLTSDRFAPVTLLAELSREEGGGGNVSINLHSHNPLLVQLTPALIHKVSQAAALYASLGSSAPRPPAPRGARGHQRFRVENATGEKVAVRAWQQAAAAEPQLLTPGPDDPLPAMALDCADSADETTQGYCVEVQLPGRSPQWQRVSLSRVGVRVLPLPDGLCAVVETRVDSARGCKITRLRSTVAVRNETSMPLYVAGVHGHLSARDGRAAVPLTDCQRGHLHLVPLGRNWQTWRCAVPLHECIANARHGQLPPPWLVTCPRLPSLCSPTQRRTSGPRSPSTTPEDRPHSALPGRGGPESPLGEDDASSDGVVVDEMLLETSLPFHCWARLKATRLPTGNAVGGPACDCVVELLPSFYFVNLLKVPLEVEFFQEMPKDRVSARSRLMRNVRSAARSVRTAAHKLPGTDGIAALTPAESDQGVMIPIDTGLIDPYKTLHLLAYDPQYPLYASLSFTQPTGLRVAGQASRSFHRLHRPHERPRSRPEFAELEDSRGVVFHASLRYVERYAGGVGLGVQLFAQYWINNQTEAEVEVALGGRRGTLAGQVQGIPPHTDWPFMAAPSKDDAEKARLRVRVGSVWSEWCDEFDSALGANGVLECRAELPADRKGARKTVQFRSLSYVLATPEGWGQSKVLCIAPRWLLVNRTPFRLTLRHDVAASGQSAAAGSLTRLARPHIVHLAYSTVCEMQLQPGDAKRHNIGRRSGNFLALGLAADRAPMCPCVCIDSAASERRNLPQTDLVGFEVVRVNVYIKGGVTHVTVDHDPAPPVVVENRTLKEVSAWQLGQRRDRSVLHIPPRTSRPLFWDAPDGPAALVLEACESQITVPLGGSAPRAYTVHPRQDPPPALGLRYSNPQLRSPPASPQRPNRGASPVLQQMPQAAPLPPPLPSSPGDDAPRYVRLRGAGRGQGGQAVRTVLVSVTDDNSIDRVIGASHPRLDATVGLDAVAICLSSDSARSARGGRQVCLAWLSDVVAHLGEHDGEQSATMRMRDFQIDDQRPEAPAGEAEGVAVAPTYAVLGEQDHFLLQVVRRQDVLGYFSHVPSFTLRLQPLCLCVEDTLIFELLCWVEEAQGRTRALQKLSDLSAAEAAAVLARECAQEKNRAGDGVMDQTVAVDELRIEAVSAMVTLRRRHDGQSDPLKGLVGRARHFVRSIDRADLKWDAYDVRNVHGTLWVLLSKLSNRYLSALKNQWYKLVGVGGVPRPLEKLIAPRDERARFVRRRRMPRDQAPQKAAGGAGAAAATRR